MLPTVLLAGVLLLAGCAAYTSSLTSAERPVVTPIAEAGVGVTIWKFPVVGLGLWGVGGGAPAYQAIVYQYSYQAVPKQTIGGIPMQPPGPPQPVIPPAGQLKESEGITPQVPLAPSAVVPSSLPMQTIYPARPFDDPTLVVIVNRSERATFRVTIDDGQPIILAPGQISPNIHLGPGTHKVRVFGEVPTVHPDHPKLKTREQELTVQIRAEGRSQIIHLHEF